jgi:hypothetical protein
VGGELDVLVAPLRRPVVAGDQAHSMQAAEVAVHERVSGLRVLGRPVRETQMPLGVVVPGMGLEEGVLLAGARLDVPPVALEDVLARLDQPPGAGDCPLVDGVRGDGFILTESARSSSSKASAAAPAPPAAR